jgi:transposase
VANQLEMAKVFSILTLHEQGCSNRQIAQLLGVHRETVRRHLEQAGRGGSKCTTNPPPGSANPPAGSNCTTNPPPGSAGPSPPGSSGPVSTCEPFRQIILDKLEQSLSRRRIWQDLVGENGFIGGYDSVKRFVRQLGRSTPLPFRRMEVAPGAEAQVDFGKGAPLCLPDGHRRRTHVFRIVLSHSRKGYSEAVLHQSTDEFLGCLENAFWAFGGMPRTIVIDNLKAAVAQADWYDPELQPKIRAFCQHYGCVVLPTKPYTPRHKGKVERGIAYVQDNGLKGHGFASLADQNEHLHRWEATVADTRIHGTTRQQVGKLFAEVERPALLPLPPNRFPNFQEARRAVHRDGHVEVDKVRYSVPPEYVGRQVWVRWDSHTVRVFNQRLEQIALHARCQPGRIVTQNHHIPAEKTSPIERGTTWLLKQAGRIGPQADRWAQQMLAIRGIEGVRVLQGLLALAGRHPADAIEHACQVAASHGSWRLKAIRELIRRGGRQQEQFEFIEQHPIIRDLAEYGQLVRAAIRQEPFACTPGEYL